MRGQRLVSLATVVVLVALLVVLTLVLTHTAVLAHADSSLDARLKTLSYRRILGRPALGQRLGGTIGEIGDGPTVVSVPTVAALATALATRRWRPIWASAGTLSVLVLAVEGGKHLIGRASPGPRGTDARLFHVGGAAFPSGHASGTLAVFGLVAVLLCGPAGIAPSRRGHRVLTALALAISAAVGLCTVVLGWHWPTDVVGGWLLGGAVLVLGNLLLGRWPAAAPGPARPRPRGQAVAAENGGAREPAPGTASAAASRSATGATS